MVSTFQKYTGCPGSYLLVETDEELIGSSGYFRWGKNLTLFGHNSAGRVSHKLKSQLFDVGALVKQEGTRWQLPFSPDEIIENLLYEKYVVNANSGSAEKNVARNMLHTAYYALRPVFPVWFRKYLQRLALRNWKEIPFPKWPVDCTVEDVIRNLWLVLLQATDNNEVPFIWFWPDGYSGCCILTHDVETANGLRLSPHVMDLVSNLGMRSSFEVIPEERYEVPQELLAQMTDRGFELCIHGLNHDGYLFSSEETFRKRAQKINEHAFQYNAVGFRSPIMYRRQDWFDALKFSYDMSVPNVGHLDPQHGGCCTVMPYFIGKIVELPLTTIQDYSLFHILKEYSTDLWKKQMDIIFSRNGLMSFIIHPDYIQEKKAEETFKNLLDYLAMYCDVNRIWHTLPKEVAEWWRLRSQMKLIEINGQWKIVGQNSERAKIAFAKLENNEVVYEF